jgi:glucose-1-phosphate adenylyltransferase
LKIVVLTQYKSHSLDLHISRTWRMSTLLGNYVTTVPAQMRRGRQWFSGSADAVYQNLNIVGDERPDYVCVFGADHIYRMDPRQMLDQHLESGRRVTVAGIRVDIAEASQFGVIEPGTGHEDRSDFLEKAARTRSPSRRSPRTSSPRWATTSFDRCPSRRLARTVPIRSGHDMGGDIIPAMVVAAATPTTTTSRTTRFPARPSATGAYWRDVGTLDSYYDASMDLISVHPIFNLYNHEWPIYTSLPSELPPAKFVFEEPGRVGHALDSIVSGASSSRAARSAVRSSRQG